MNATLKFNLPEERAEHLLAVKAPELASAITETWNQIRNWLKHGHDFKTPDEGLEACRALLDEIYSTAMRERNKNATHQTSFGTPQMAQRLRETKAARVV